jgi:tripartite ATP-independent transporter DctM subunit
LQDHPDDLTQRALRPDRTEIVARPPGRGTRQMMSLGRARPARAAGGGTALELAAHAADAAVNIIVVAAIAVQVLVLFGDVVARALAKTYFVGTTDLSALNMSIIAFGGAVIADRRQRHAAMNVLVGRLPPGRRAIAAAVSDWLILLIAVLLAASAVPLLAQGWSQPSPVLHIRETWNVAPFPAAMALIALGAAGRLLRRGPRVAGSVGLAVVLAAGLTVLATRAGHLSMIGPLAALLQIALLLALVVAGVPVGFALMVAATAYLYASGIASPVAVTINMTKAVDNFVLVAVPFFILVGLIMAGGGLSRRLAGSLRLLIGRLYGGLLQVVIVATFIFSGISGAKIADIVAVGTPLKGVLAAGGYDLSEAAAVLAASAAAGETVPPSIVMLVLGSITSLSIAALFAAGLLPAAVISVGLMVTAYLRARRRGLREDVSATLGEKARSIGACLPALSVPVLLVGSILGGIATPTEVSAVAVVYGVCLVTLLYREVSWRDYWNIFLDGAAMSGLVLLLVSAAAPFAWSLAAAQLPEQVVALVQHLGSRPEIFLLLSVPTMVVLGAVLEGLPAIIIVAPLLLPLAARLGINPLQYGVLLIICMGTGHFAPPIGIGLYVACPIMGAPFGVAARRMVPYLAVLLVGAVLVAFVPFLSTWLPGTIFRR